MSEPLYPDIVVDITGEPKRSFIVMGLVTSALKQARVPLDVINEFIEECMHGDYEGALATCREYVTVRP